jgi:predicted HicB family RNase H-like nuclease
MKLHIGRADVAKFTLRMPAILYRQIVERAEAQNLSVQQYIVKMLEKQT